MSGKITASKIILGLQCIAVAAILGYALASERPHITIRLQEAKKLHRVDHYRTKVKKLDDPSSIIKGAFHVAITNQSTNAVDLVDWNVHNLLFQDQDGASSVLIHDCELIDIAFTYTATGKIKGAFTLGPGETKVITLDSFSCEGPFYSLPGQGIYRGGAFTTVYRIVPLDAVRTRLSQYLTDGADITVLLQQMERLVASDAFWAAAYVSHPCSITLNSP